MNTNKQDAISMAIKLKRKGLLNRQIVRELDALGYRNPKTLKPWTKGLVQKKVEGIYPDKDSEALAQARALKIREQGLTIVQIVKQLEQEGFISYWTQRPFGLSAVTRWVNNIEPSYKSRAKKRALELFDEGVYLAEIVRVLAKEGLINKLTGKPYSKSSLYNWIYL
jgi:hypothetical protein